MLNRFTDVDESGTYHSKVKSLDGRFFAVTEKLLSGRICIASMCVGASRACLYIAITYASKRLAVGPKGESDTPIFAYQLQQNALIPLLARSVSLGLLHVMCKDIYQNPAGHKDDLLSLCCVDKTLNGWNLERVASVCRERCGGQGYLAHNKFGDYIAVAHAALTAEGDNRVLMVKVCKDMMTNILKRGHKLPELQNCPFRTIAKLSDVTQLNILCDLLKFRETVLFQQLLDATKAKQKTHSKYQVLMRETSDAMQNLAQAYGERHALEYCIKVMSTQITNAQNKSLMQAVFRLFGAEMIARDLGFYMMNGVVNKEAAENLTTTRHQLIKEVAAQAFDLMDCLSIPKHALYAPIAGDYVKYNSEPNFGEIHGARNFTTENHGARL